MTDIITGPGNYCRADGVKVRIANDQGMWRGNDGWVRDSDGELSGFQGDPERLISTWADRPDEFRKPKPAYRKDGTPRWPVGTRAVLVAWEDGHTAGVGDKITVRDDGHAYWDDGNPYRLDTYTDKGERPLFRKINDADPKPEPRELVLYGVPGGEWDDLQFNSDTHKLTIRMDGDQVTGTLEAL